MLGRAIGPPDERIRPPRVVVLSYGFWQRLYGGARDVIPPGASLVFEVELLDVRK